MSTFRSALRVVASHPIYLVAYVVLLSLLGVAVVSVAWDGFDVSGGGYEARQARVAVVDRDGSELSGALAEAVDVRHELVEVADERHALQDALARTEADCVVVLPEGFGDALLADARAGCEAEPLQVAYGTDVQAGALAAQAASQWASLAASAAALEPGATASEVAEVADAAFAAEVEVGTVSSEDAAAPADALAAFLSFSTYSVTSSIVVVAGVVLTAFGRPDLRRRLGASPVPPSRRAAGELGACLVLVVGVWAWTCLVALISCGSRLAGADPTLVGLALASLLPLSLVPLALAFLLAQLGLGEDAINAVGNIGAMVLSMLGGAWMPLSMLPESVQLAARLTPTYWTTTTVEALLHADAPTSALLAEVAASTGVVLLFAITLAAVGLALGRARRPGAA